MSAERDYQQVQQAVAEIEGGEYTGQMLADFRALLCSLTGGNDPDGRLPGWEARWAERYGMTPERLLSALGPHANAKA